MEDKMRNIKEQKKNTEMNTWLRDIEILQESKNQKYSKIAILIKIKMTDNGHDFASSQTDK